GDSHRTRGRLDRMEAPLEGDVRGVLSDEAAVSDLDERALFTDDLIGNEDIIRESVGFIEERDDAGEAADVRAGRCDAASIAVRIGNRSLTLGDAADDLPLNGSV